MAYPEPVRIQAAIPLHYLKWLSLWAATEGETEVSQAVDIVKARIRANRNEILFQARQQAASCGMSLEQFAEETWARSKYRVLQGEKFDLLPEPGELSEGE